MAAEEEAAKAVGKVAEFGTRALTTVEKAGGYLATVFGALPENLIGLAGDWVHHRRLRNWELLGEKTEAILKRRGITANVDDLSPSIAVPLLSAAVDETRSDLQELWARLLANAMDPARAGTIRQRFIEALKQMDPLDALVLRQVYEMPSVMAPTVAAFLAGSLKTREGQIEVSFENLHRVGCMPSMNIPGLLSQPASMHLTAFGRELMDALSD
jgi:hypothetical protein